MNVLDLLVSSGVGRAGEMEFPAPGCADGQVMRIGFRPYAVQVSPDPAACRYRAVLQHTFFLGVMMRLELELPSGLTVRARLTKEDYTRLGLTEGQEVSFQIRQYRLLASEGCPLSSEIVS
jgi:hypothetical protein